MADPSQPTCRLVRPDDTYDGKQGLTYFCGIAAETVGSKGICMHLLTIPPGGRAKAHMHESHETAIYVLDGEAVALYGDRLQSQAVTKAGDLFYIPASIVNMTSGHLSIMYGITGPNLAVITACTTSTHAVGIGMRTIQYGDADVVIAGGSEMAQTPTAVGGFCQARALSTLSANSRRI